MVKPYALICSLLNAFIRFHKLLNAFICFYTLSYAFIRFYTLSYAFICFHIAFTCFHTFSYTFTCFYKLSYANEEAKKLKKSKSVRPQEDPWSRFYRLEIMFVTKPSV